MAEIYFEPIRDTKPASSFEIKRANDRSISRQLDELVRIARAARDKSMGADAFRECRELYTIQGDESTFPSFQPRVSIPQLQTLCLNEATDITDAVPKIYITLDDNRDKEREKYFQALWRSGFVNNRLLEAVIWSMYCNMGYLQVGFDPLARHGKGTTWVDSCNPAMVYVDPYAKRDDNVSFVVFENWIYVDEVRRRWPDTGWAVKPRYVSETEPGNMTDVSLEYPEMSPLAMHGQSPSQRIFRDNRVRVRTLYCFDNARQRIKDYAGTNSVAADLIVDPKWEYKFPDGRWITEAEGVVLADGNSWMPKLPDDNRGTFPFVRLAATPPLHDIYGPPPIRFTKTIQSLAERLHTQLYENCVRLNNGVIVMRANSGLQASDIGWLPGEILTINAQADPPQVIAPQPLPAHMIQVPAILLDLQKELMGYGQARTGEGQPGNISAELFDATLWQQQAMTRLRGRLISEPLQRLAQMIFYIEARYKIAPDHRIDQGTGASSPGGTQGFVQWRPTSRWPDFEVELDQGSLRVLSAAAFRSVTAALAKANMLPTESVLEAFGVPHASELAEEKTREMELQAVTRLRKPR